MKNNLYIFIDRYDDYEIEYRGDGEPDSVVSKVLADIKGYSADPADIYIGTRLFAFDGRCMWQIAERRGERFRVLTYDANGEYYESKQG